MMPRTDSGPMRAAPRLDDDVHRTVRILAAIERTSVGRIPSRLARCALSPDRASHATPDGFPASDVPADAAPLTPDRPGRPVMAALSDVNLLAAGIA